jgi:dGTPase
LGGGRVHPPPAGAAFGLNLTYRSLASVLKYDRKISRNSRKIQKGYYQYDSEIVEAIKSKVLNGAIFDEEFKTIECSIMDIADDIAYSTYDLEDSFKAGLLSPLDLFALSPDISKRVVATITKRLREYLGDSKASFSEAEMIGCLFNIFEEMFEISNEERQFLANPQIPRGMKKLHEALQIQRLSERIARDGYERVKTTSDLVQDFMNGVEVTPNPDIPAMSKARLNLETFKKVEVLKNITYEAIIMSPRMRVVEYRGYDVIKGIIEAIVGKNGHMLLPNDYRELYQGASGNQHKRIICDYIAGMTDRYAWQFYNRICGGDPMTIHLPV